MISNCGHDERGKYSGGKAGDQTGNEYRMIPWYNRPWNYVLRYPYEKVAREIATLAQSAANNNHIGYNQAERRSFWEQLKKVGYNPAKITVNCNADCSASTAAIVKCVGYRLNIPALQNVSADMYTGNERNVLSRVGFEVLTDAKYLRSEDYLLPGDILLYENHHTAIEVTGGSKASFPVAKPVAPQKPLGWTKAADGKRWWYRTGQNDNTDYLTGWQKLSTSDGTYWFWFDNSGYMATGWKQIDNKWYYFSEGDTAHQGALWKTDDNGAQYLWRL